MGLFKRKKIIIKEPQGNLTCEVGKILSTEVFNYWVSDEKQEATINWLVSNPNSIETLEIPSKLTGMVKIDGVFVERTYAVNAIGGALVETIRGTYDVLLQDDSKFCIQNKVLYSKDGKNLLCALKDYPIKINVQSGVECIEDRAFSDLDRIEKIVLPESVKVIGNEAFKGCKNLKEIVLSGDVEGIGKEAIADCPKLRIRFSKINSEFLDNRMSHYQKSKEQPEEKMLFEAFDNEVKQHLPEIEYNQRKLLFVTKDYNKLDQNTILVLSKDNLPDIFPKDQLEHPAINSLYVGHPAVPNRYIPFDNYEEEFLEDKLREFCLFVQCLGATEIEVLSTKEFEQYKQMKREKELGGGINYNSFEAKGDYSSDYEAEWVDSLRNKLSINQKYNPGLSLKKIESLVWYKHEPSWQRLYQQRILMENGSISEYNETMELSRSSVISSQETDKISADIDVLFAEINANYSKAVKEKISKKESRAIHILVRFEPIENLKGK